MKQLPNLLSFARIALAPYIFLLLWRREYGAVLLLFGVAGITDFLDGFLARRWQGHSRLGAYLDPVADKILLSGSFLVLALSSAISTWVAALVIGRDLAILLFSGGVMLFSRAPRELPPSFWGKASTTAQILFVLAVVAELAGFMDGFAVLVHSVVVILQWIVVALTVWSGLDYGWRGIALGRANG